MMVPPHVFCEFSDTHVVPGNILLNIVEHILEQYIMFCILEDKMSHKTNFKNKKRRKPHLRFDSGSFHCLQIALNQSMANLSQMD